MVKSSGKSGGTGGGRSAHLSEYAAGAIIVQEGAPGSEMFIIEDGEVEIVRMLGDSERVVTTLGPGDFFGEMSVLENRARSATARAKSACRLLPIDATTLDALLREHPEVAVRMMRKLSARLRGYEEQEERAARAGMARLTPKAPASPAAPMSPAASASSASSTSPAAPQPAPPPVEGRPRAAAETPYAGIRAPGPMLAAVSARAAGARLEHASGWSILIQPGSELVIGRPDPVTGAVPEIDLSPLDTERSLSRRHARIIGRDGNFFLREEVGTSNGTWVGADRLSSGVERQLADKDRLRFGRLDFVFRHGESA
ncbi:MAG: cyclic nucleotide-binding domain-containing protein [Thermoanaerobaculia bacterium]